MATLERLREAHPDLFTLPVIAGAWGEMTYRYVAAVKEGTRKMLRMLPEAVRKGELRRKALTPMPDGRSRWGYPATFLMEHPTGFWLSLDVPRLGEKVSRNTWKAFVGIQPKRPDGGTEDAIVNAVAPIVRVPDSDYPAGHPPTETELKACRNHRPKSLPDGKYIWWDFHAILVVDHLRIHAQEENMRSSRPLDCTC